MRTVYEALVATASRHPENPWMVVPAKADRDYLPGGAEISYGAALAEVDARLAVYRRHGFGRGHRVALMLENRPEHFFHLWALNALGVSVVPVNPDYLLHELVYLLEHSEADAVVALAKYTARASEAVAKAGRAIQVAVAEDFAKELRAPARAVRAGAPERGDEAVLMYTSGTTGRPKGCMLSNEFAFAVGEWYARIGGRLTLEHGRERVFVPLPLFHVNAGINTPTALILTANCLIMPDRFHPKSWWADLAATRASGLHYLGIVPPILLKAPPCPEERQHCVKFGLGAGIDPALHRQFEERFGIAMVEVWGMTETGRFFGDNHEPRRIDTRAFGRPIMGMEAKVVDENDRDVPRGAPGELVVRTAGPDPRRGFFSGYLKDEAATEHAWRGGWFHTGDVVTQDETGMLAFVERRKNIIRRSGENISAAEVEEGLITHPAVERVAVIAVPDELRDEEVMACIVPTAGQKRDLAAAQAIFDWGRERLAYFKLPGWIAFVDDLPVTRTQKVQKGLIFPPDVDPRSDPRSFDLRAFKKRQAA
jgi:crotonobetaine/carnitine-CoA ligase